MLRFIPILAFALGACTTTDIVQRPGEQHEYLIGCGAASGWNICYNRANEICPTGYDTMQQAGGFNRKELLIHCPNA